MFANYELIEKRWIDDLNSEGYLLKHTKTGARVCMLLNDDDNKVFYIGFRTPPVDSTGVPHILEHSVLCGSDKYPVKDPFVELAKGSLNTFLNAMTYPDKTVYPVASCNDKDFNNLVQVYLDAVFRPNIYKEEKIFRQEGWHFELDSPEAELAINGVVYNEMKGVYSSADDVVEQEIIKALYPNATYGVVSGGDPEVIPSLSYEDFLRFHATYYHPSNSYIYLYGNINPDEYLKLLDEEYLSRYERLEVDSHIELEHPFDCQRDLNIDYPVLEETEERSYLSYSVVMGTSLDPELYIGMDVLDYVLFSAPGATVKQALTNAGIGEEIYTCVESGIYQPYFAIIAKNAKEQQKDEFVRIIEDELKKAVKDGLSKKSLNAALNIFEFRYREADFGSYPRGLMLGLQAFDSWLYDEGKPFLHIEANETFSRLRRAIDEGYFESLIEQYLLNNQHKVILTALPKAGLTARKEEELRNKLAKYKATLSKEQLDEIVSNTAALKAYQQEPSSEEDLLKIPMLKKEDLKQEAPKLILEETKTEGITEYRHDIFTNQIGYLKLLFNLKDIPGDLFPYIGILKAVLGMLDTTEHSYNDLFDEINIHTGGINFGVLNIASAKNIGQYELRFSISAKMFYQKLDNAYELISELLLKTKLDDTKRLKEILLELRSRLESSAVSQGHVVALGRALSYQSPTSAIDEIISGIDFLRLVQKLCDSFEQQGGELVKHLEELRRCIFRAENLSVDIIGSPELFEANSAKVLKLKDALYTEQCRKEQFVPAVVRKNEGFKTAGQVQYVCRAGNFVDAGLKYTGGLRVLKTILSYDYLWNNIRVLGGAYGAMNSFGRSGNSFLVSYRDPNLENTVRIYENAAGYIESLKLGDRNILQFIIGTLSELDTPLTPSGKGSFALRATLSGLTDEDIQLERDEILGIDEEAIHLLASYIEAIMKQNNFCVVGNSDNIDKAKDMFIGTLPLI